VGDLCNPLVDYGHLAEPSNQPQRGQFVAMENENPDPRLLGLVKLTVGVALAQHGKRMSAWVIWQPPGIDSWVETTGGWTTQELKGWWQEYLASHPQLPSTKSRQIKAATKLFRLFDEEP
jgi:hypothetical protein